MLKICFDRARRNLDALAKIGRNSAGGIDRALGSEEDARARLWLSDYWRGIGLGVRTDAIGNMWAVYKGSEETLPPIAVGSHHDAVTNGGMYDGALGVLLATELVETLKENGVRPKHDIAVVSFTGEEPNPYEVSTLGSKVVSGRLGRDGLAALKNAETGEPLGAYIGKVGGDIEKAGEALLAPGEIGAFIECHIEQGRRLFDNGLPLAAVGAIIGIYREYITVTGMPNHAGTTMMKDRRDALLAASELNLAFECFVTETGLDEVVGTVGVMDVMPNSVNIIPGQVGLVLEIRAMDKNVKDGIVKRLDGACVDIEARRGVRIARRVNLDQPGVVLDGDVRDAVKRAVTDMGETCPVLLSMAGHDAANLQRVTKSGMLFVQSVNGESHCPNEFTGDREIEKAGNALLGAVMILDGVLDGEKTL